jgi:DNA modification methylase
LLNVLNSAGCGFLSGGIGIGFRMRSAGLPYLLRDSGAVNNSDEVVRLLNDSLSGLISTDGRTENKFVARFDVARGAQDGLSTGAALQLFSLLKLGGAQLIRTSAGASRLPSMLESRRISIVSDFTNRTLSFDLFIHPVILSSKGFMGKAWDGSKVAFDVATWKEVYRVLKPGAHMAVFCGTRTAHRVACAIEDAGFELRDTISWNFGSGFPKSLDVSKAIDKAARVEREAVGYDGSRARPNRVGCVMGDKPYDRSDNGATLTAPATDAAKRWHGYGTALKPAHEIIYLCRKPISESSIAANVLRWGTGALNIDGCRIKTNDDTARRGEREALTSKGCKGGGWSNQTAPNRPRVDMTTGNHPQGRWPANVILSHSPACNSQCAEGCPVRELDQQSGDRPAGGTILEGTDYARMGFGFASGESTERHFQSYADSGGASRFYFTAEWSDDDFIPLFYYVAKASRNERDAGLDGLTDSTMNRVNPGGLENDPRWQPIEVKNSHPTVKPVSLMAYLCKLITPPGGTVLDCFAGSGTTGRAAMNGGFKAILIEQDEAWLEVINARCATQLGLPL